MAYGLEWLNLTVRWLHLIVGIAWIGASFYFVWLDNTIRPPRPGSALEARGVSGELWAVHGGGFYNPQKYLLAPPELPQQLHWFKWEAYSTWLSGFALLVIVYYANASAMLVDRSVADIGAAQAIAIGVGALVAAWAVYDGLCRSPLSRHQGWFGAVVFLLLTAAAYGLSQVLSGRAAYIHVGAMIGTIMVGNVLMVIIPGQKKMVVAMMAGQAPDPVHGRRGKERSVHNNYFTLPVIFIMVSNHYATTYAHPQNWAVLTLMMAAGVSIRHFFNRKHKGVYAWQYPLIGAVLLAIVGWWTAPHLPPLPPVKGEVTFNRVRAIIGERCVTCHSPSPTFPGYTAPQAGVKLHTPADIAQNAQRVYQQVVVTRIMPLGNLTKITDEERAVIAAWVKAGAKVE